MSSFRRVAAIWVLRQVARRAFGTGAQRRRGATGTGWADASSAGSTGRPAGARPTWARAAGPRAGGVPQQVEELVRRTWPMLDTPANRERVVRFVERMRAAASTPR